jgi:hypothetical protein
MILVCITFPHFELKADIQYIVLSFPSYWQDFKVKSTSLLGFAYLLPSPPSAQFYGIFAEFASIF